MSSDPLNVIRGDLVAAAGRRIRVRRRRRKRAVVVMALLLAALASTAVASSLTSFGTGIPRIDRLLDRTAAWQERANREQREQIARRGGDPDARPWPMPPRPGLGRASAPVTVPWGNGLHGVGVAFVSQHRMLCFTIAPPPRYTPQGKIGSGCFSPRLLRTHLARSPVRFATGGGALPDRIILQGYARADVVSLRARNSLGPLSTRLAKPWQPALPGVPRIRAFVATGRLAERERRELRPREIMKIYSARFEARLADGGTVRSGPG